MSGELFAKLGLNLVSHQSSTLLGEATMGLYTFCVLYSRLHELDGVVPKHIAERGWSGDVEANRKHLEGLCSERVLFCTRLPNGDYFIEKFSEWNETKKQIAERRTAIKTRKSKYLEKVRGTRSERVPPVSVSVSVKSLSLNKDEVEEPVAPESSVMAVARDVESEPGPEPGKTQRLAMREIEFRDAYCRGIADGKGGPYAWPGGIFDQGSLNECVKTFGKGKHGKVFRGEAVTEWVFDWSAEFAEDVTRKGEAQYYSAYGPKGFKRWLNEQVSKREAKEVG